MKDMKEEAPYRDADGDYKDIEKKGPFEIGFAQGGMPRRKSWADTALTAARFMAMFATAMLVAFMVYSQHRYTRGLPLITNSSSMEMVASSDDSCGL